MRVTISLTDLFDIYLSYCSAVSAKLWSSQASFGAEIEERKDCSSELLIFVVSSSLLSASLFTIINLLLESLKYMLTKHFTNSILNPLPYLIEMRNNCPCQGACYQVNHVLSHMNSYIVRFKHSIIDCTGVNWCCGESVCVYILCTVVCVFTHYAMQ